MLGVTSRFSVFRLSHVPVVPFEIPIKIEDSIIEHYVNTCNLNDRAARDQNLTQSASAAPIELRGWWRVRLAFSGFASAPVIQEIAIFVVKT